MQKFQLELFFKIIGIGSASGLLFHQDALFLISDNSSYLYEYKLEKEILSKIPLVEQPQENIPKKVKQDFESLTLKGNKLLVLGSGSTENRTIAKTYHLKSKEVKTIDYTKHYNAFREIANLKINELNIEGLFEYKKKTYFFQRGNGESATNGIFILNTKDEITFNKVSLPKINNIEASFTDAILVDDMIYFLASVENTVSTYDDGEILGTFLGKMKLKDFFIENTLLISEKHKFEGITLFQKSKTEITFLLCEDNDTDLLESNIYKIKINL